MAKITTLYEDSAKTEALYPRTKVSAVSDGDNTSLEELLQNLDTDLVNLGVISDLDIDVSTFQPVTAYIGRTNGDTLNKPDSAGGGLVFMITSNTAQWTRVVYYSDAGMYLRVATSGIWHDWTPMFVRSISYNSATLNSSYFSGGNALYYKIGNLVVLAIDNITQSANVAGGIVGNLITGLPKPTRDEAYNLTRFNTDETWRIRLNTDGTIQSHYDAQTAGQAQWSGNFVYIAKES